MMGGAAPRSTLLLGVGCFGGRGCQVEELVGQALELGGQVAWR